MHDIFSPCWGVFVIFSKLALTGDGVLANLLAETVTISEPSGLLSMLNVAIKVPQRVKTIKVASID